MAVIGEEKRLVRFGIFEADLKTGELHRNGSRVRLQEQPFQILTVLLERPGEVVTREELRARLWAADTFVDFDHSLNTAVRRLRDALGDSAENPRFVETVARRGYRFVAPVDGLPTASDPAQPAVPAATQSKRWPVVLAIGVVLLVGVSVGWHAGHHAAAPKLMLERPLTANASELPVLAGVISPDGKYLAFCDARGLYLRQVETGETHPLPLPANFNARPAAWFPDGTHLLATWVADPQEPAGIWEIPLFGGSPRKLIEHGSSPQVSPDGLQIAYLSGASSDGEIWIAQADGRGARKILAADGNSMFGPPTWSPDGKSLAFARGLYSGGLFTMGGRIEVISLKTGNSSVLLPEAPKSGTLAWTADNHIIYSSSEPVPNTNDSNLWALPVDATGRSTGSPVRLTNQPGMACCPSVTSDGKQLAYFRRTIEPDVYVADLDARAPRVTDPRRLTLDERSDFPFDWTADGKAVIFASNRNGHYEVFKQDIGQTEPELLAREDQDISVARLAPDGRSLLYQATPPIGDSAGRTRMQRISLEGGPATTLFSLPRVNNHQCARAPATICLVSMTEAGRESFYSFDPDKGLGRELPRLGIRSVSPFDFNWTLSPDGRFLAMGKKEGIQKDSAIRILSLTGDSEQLLPVPGWAGLRSIDWAADSKSIFATAYTSTGKQSLLNITTAGKIRPVLEENKMQLGWTIPSPDGKHIAFWKASGSSNVLLLENYLDGGRGSR